MFQSSFISRREPGRETLLYMKAFVLLLFTAALSLSGADLTGTWEVFISGGQMNDARRVTIASENGQYKWHLRDLEFTGALQGDAVNFNCIRKGKPCGDLKGLLAASGMSGDGVADGIPVKWSARRPAARPSSAPTRHDFTPTVFYREFSGAKEPVLHIFPG